MKKRVLVTGATGFIGRHSLQPLTLRGYEVHAVCQKNPLDSKVTWHNADLLSASAAEALCREVKASYLLHFAWIATPGVFYTSPLNEVWKAATLQLVSAFRKYGGTRAVVAGTCAEYDWSLASTPLSENSPCRPATLYGKAKSETRLALEAFAEQSGMSLGWGRVFFLYGPYEPAGKFVAYVINELLAGRKALLSHGEQVRDFLYVQDVADAFAALLDSDVRGPVNIASGEAVTLKEIAREIAHQIGKDELLSFGAREAPANEPAFLVADVTRLQKELGWTPRTPLKKGVEETIAWWRAHSSPNSLSDRG